MTSVAKIETPKVVKKKIYFSKNKKILLELIKQEKKEINKDGNV